MIQLWEYRVHTVRLSGDGEGDSRTLTNIARPRTHEQGAGGWDIFAVEPNDSSVRLYMKRPAVAAQAAA
jgi:hypothetical protein